MSRAALIAALIAALLAAGCVPALPSSYTCTTDAQCVSRGVHGVCEPVGNACSFPDSSCDSGKRYGSLGPPPLAGSCVSAALTDMSSVGDLRSADGGVSASITRVASSTLAPGSHGATATVPRPNGTVAGDLLFASIFADDNTITVTAPAGWTTSADLTGGVAGVFRATWLYHFVAAAGEPTSYAFQLSGSPQTAAGAIVAYRGVASAPIDTGMSTVFQATTFVAPSITTTHANDMLLAMFVNGSSSSGLGWTAPPGMSTAVNLSTTGMFDQTQAVAGASGTRQATAGVAVPGIGAVDFVALTPAP